MINQRSSKLFAIVAMAENRVIGNNNQLPWHLPADLKHFKTITTGHPILMGRKTHESIGRALPNRTNIILTRDKSYQAPGCKVVHSIKEALQEEEGEIYLIGGADIYKQAMPLVQRLYLTIVHKSFEGDAYFPELNMIEWKEVSRKQHSPDRENTVGYSFVILERI